MSRATAVNYLLLLSLGLIWGAQFLFVKLAIAAFAPAHVAAGRIAIGAATMLFLVWLLRHKKVFAEDLPTPRGLRVWGHFFLIGLFEATIPFFLIAWGQQHIESSIAAILLGTVPLMTLVLSAIFVPGESLRLGSVLAVLLGLAGVIVLVGPGALSGVLANVAGELALLGASASFAVAYVLIKLLPPAPLMLKVRNMLICASLQILVAAAIVAPELDPGLPLVPSLAVLVLGLVCSGLVFIPFVALIQRAGPTFTSLNNALIPPIGLFLGAVFLGNAVTWSAAAAVVLIVLALAAMMLPARKG